MIRVIYENTIRVPPDVSDVDVRSFLVEMSARCDELLRELCRERSIGELLRRRYREGS